MDVLAWLIEGDPAVRWQALRQLCDADAATVAAVAAERARVAREGLGAVILAAQGADGPWHQGGEPDWLPTLHMLQLLGATGVDPADPSVTAMLARLEAGFRWADELGGGRFFAGETEPCINGRVLALGAHFGRPEPALARRLLGEQLADGGWNCEAPKSTRASFHSTLCVLEGLLAYQRAGAPPAEAAAVAQARRRGEAYLLERRLLFRRSTGALVDPEFLLAAFPGRYRYDVLRALDYLRDAGVSPDERVVEAVRALVHRRLPDGRWPLDAAHLGGVTVALDEAVGQPSRWNTLRALRVLRWAGARG